MITTKRLSVKNSKMKITAKPKDTKLIRRRTFEFYDQLFENDKCSIGYSVTEKDSKVKYSSAPSSRKRGSPNTEENQKNSRRRPNCPKKSPSRIGLLPKNLMMSDDEKKRLKKYLLELSRRKIPPNLSRILQELGLKEEKVDVNMDEETLSRLKKVINGCLAPRDAKVEAAKMTENGKCRTLGKSVPKGVTWRARVSSVTWRAKVSTVTSEIPFGRQGRDGCKMDNPVKKISKSQIGKSDPGSKDVVNGLDKENAYLCLQFSTLGSTTAAKEGCTPVSDVQLSPKHALRAAMLKSRFADTILKAQQKTLLDHAIQADTVKRQQERAGVKTKVRTAEDASRLKRTKLQRDRESARLALDKMENTAEI